MSNMSESIIELEKKLANALANSRANEAIAQKLFDIETQIISYKSSIDLELLQQLYLQKNQWLNKSNSNDKKH